MKEESNLSLEYQNHPLVLQRALQGFISNTSMSVPIYVFLGS